MPTEGLYLMDNTYIPMLGRVIARCGLTGVSFVCQIKSGGECVRPVQSILPQRASALCCFELPWLRRLALASSAMGSSLNRSQPPYALRIQHASRCGTTE
ncbi:hypothetical protein BCR43DRAFT_500181 [Syncephalastrum racemosum]|uniref:Uncharacterized protein n=1 Tax=Syncephalastrum racemosum TaxID=13706 RepID=A0A1X2GYT6_SYNRA|nr:hypothetical protein BCR43DRAFT_500181 [Syncephalastrum racemosum]